MAAVAIPSRTPRRSPETSPLPSATSPTPANEITAAIQKRRDSRSSPSASPITAANTGVAPRMSAIVDAVVFSSAYTNESWLRKINSAASATSGRSRRAIRSVRSPTRTITRKTAVASP